MVNAANKTFASALPNSDEDNFKREIINSDTKSKIIRVLKSDERLACKLIQTIIIDSGDQFFIDVESRIIYFINEGKDPSFIKERVKVYFDKHTSGVLKDFYLKTYFKLIYRLHSGRKTPKEVFGRDVEPYKPKSIPNPDSLPFNPQE